MNNGYKDRGGNIVVDSPKASEVEVGGASEVGEVILEGEGAIKYDTQVTDREWKS